MRDHTSLKAWQAAREVALGCSLLARDHWKPWAGPLLRQLQRASLSVQLNLAEGYAIRSHGRTRQLWLTAYGSAVETLECLALLHELGAAPPETLSSLLSRARDSSGATLGLIRSLGKRVGDH